MSDFSNKKQIDAIPNESARKTGEIRNKFSFQPVNSFLALLRVSQEFRLQTQNLHSVKGLELSRDHRKIKTNIFLFIKIIYWLIFDIHI